MPFSSRANDDPEKIRQYLEEEALDRKHAGSSMLGRAANAPARPRQGGYESGFKDDGSDFGTGGGSALGTSQGRAAMIGEARSGAAPAYGDPGSARGAIPDALPPGMTAPAYWKGQPGANAPPRPSSPTNAAPGAAMGLQSRPDPFGRAVPPAGPAQFAQQAAAGKMSAGGAPAAAGGAAAAGAGGLASAMPIVAVIAQYKAQQDAANEMRRNAREGIQQDYAASLGYPMYGVRAAQANRDASEQEGGDYLQYLMPFMGKLKG